MTDALPIITGLAKEGKTPLEIARELHARGVFNARGKPISPDMVVGLLRFVGVAVPVSRASMPVVSDAVWGRSASPVQGSMNEDEEDGPEPGKKRRNRWNPRNALPDELKAKITRLYQYEHLKSHEIAARLGVSLKKVAPFCAVLSGFTMPPGEVTVVFENGQKITRCPPGYARGAGPQRNVRPTQGGW